MQQSTRVVSKRLKEGVHHGKGRNKELHKKIAEAMTNAKTQREFAEAIQEWAVDNLHGGIKGLPAIFHNLDNFSTKPLLP